MMTFICSCSNNNHSLPQKKTYLGRIPFRKKRPTSDAAAAAAAASRGDAAGVSSRRGCRGIREAAAETRAAPDRNPSRGHLEDPLAAGLRAHRRALRLRTTARARIKMPGAGTPPARACV